MTDETGTGGPLIQLDLVVATLPFDLELLRSEARAEGFRFIERLVEEWVSAVNRLSRDGETLLVARVGEVLAGIGGLTQEPALPGALRMRRFYVRPAYRRLSISRRIAEALMARPRPAWTLPRGPQPGTIITVNAGTPLAPAFWD